MSYYNGKKILSVVQVKEVEVDYYVGCATYDTTKENSFVVPSYIQVNGANFPILDNTKTSVFEIGGNSVSFNQLFNPKTTTITQSGLTITYNANTKSYSVSGTATEEAYINLNETTIQTIANHNYLLKGCASGGGASTYYLYLSGNMANREEGNGVIFNVSTAGSRNVVLVVKNGVSVNIEVRPQLHDLSLMSLESITIADFNALYPLGDYDYNEGEIFSTAPSAIESWGYNLFDGELEQGYISTTGVDMPNNYWLRAKNYMKVKGGNTYKWIENNFSNYLYALIATYDINKNFLERIDITSSKTNGYTIKNNVAYIRILYSNAGASEYTTIPTNPEICFYNSSINLGYKPYVGKLGQINLPNAPITLNGVNDIHDLLTFVEQADGTYNAILTRKIGLVDLGVQSWATATYGFYFTLNNAKPVSSLSQVGNIMCFKYQIASSNQTHMGGLDKSMAIDEAKHIQVRDSSYSTPNDFKASVNGVYLYYELATPTTETIAIGLTFDQVSTLFEKGGTIQVKDGNGDYVQCDLSMAFAIRRFRSVED